MTTTNKTALAIGATCVVGTKLVEELCCPGGDWNIIGLSRRGASTAAAPTPATSPSTCSIRTTPGRSWPGCPR